MALFDTLMITFYGDFLSSWNTNVFSSNEKCRPGTCLQALQLQPSTPTSTSTSRSIEREHLFHPWNTRQALNSHRKKALTQLLTCLSTCGSRTGLESQPCLASTSTASLSPLSSATGVSTQDINNSYRTAWQKGSEWISCPRCLVHSPDKILQ
jgi:hypothetical protein